MELRSLIDKLGRTRRLSEGEWIDLIENRTSQAFEYLRECSCADAHSCREASTSYVEPQDGRASMIVVGLPGQSSLNLARELMLLAELNPHAVEVRPYVYRPNSRAFESSHPSDELAAYVYAAIRLMLPHANVSGPVES